MIKQILSSFWDWKRQWFQILLLVIVFCLPLVFGAEDKLSLFFNKNDVDLENYFYYIIWSLGKWGICLVAAITFDVLVICSWNEDFVLNRGMLYHDHFYLSYCFCAGILGYKKCSLKLVPIPLQFKLILYETFSEYIYDDGIHDPCKGDKKEKGTKVFYENNSKFTQRVNLVLIDTYPIQKGQLPHDVLGLTTVYVERTRIKKDKMRYSSEEFLKKVLNTVREWPDVVTEVNIFATLNPSNCYNIVKEVFCTGGRDNIRHIWVYKQEGNPPRHFYGGVKIY